MAWLTTASSANQHIDDYRKERVYYFSAFTLAAYAYQDITTTQYRWVGIEIASVAAIVDSKSAESGNIDCHYTPNGDGSATVHQTVQTVGALTLI